MYFYVYTCDKTVEHVQELTVKRRTYVMIYTDC